MKTVSRSEGVQEKEEERKGGLFAQIRQRIMGEEAADLDEGQRLELCDRLDEAIGVSWELERSSCIETPDFRVGLSMRLASDLGLGATKTRQLDLALGEIVEQVTEGERLPIVICEDDTGGQVLRLWSEINDQTDLAAERLRKRIGGGHAIP